MQLKSFETCTVIKGIMLNRVTVKQSCANVYLFIYLLALQSYKSAIKYITKIEGMVNRTRVPCEDQPDTKQQVDIH
jgi:hypothetical protein